MTLELLRDLRGSKLSRDLLEEWLLDLAIKNNSRIESCSSLEVLWSTDVTEFIFNICKKLRTSNDVKYFALEIFERFIAQHVLDLYQSVEESKNTDKPLKWQNVEKRVLDQVVLRVVTSVQLASKLQSHYENITPLEVQEVLKCSGRSFGFQSLLQSEFRVMRALKYKLNVTTPAMYVEVLLHVLLINDPTINKDLFPLSFKVLDLVYFCRSQIYCSLYETVTGTKLDKISSQSELFIKIKADYMMLSVSIIVAASYLIFNQESLNLILEQLHQVTRISRKDIEDFSLVILDVTLEE